MDKTCAGSSGDFQGHSTYLTEDGTLQPQYQYPTYTLQENYCNPQQFDVLTHHLRNHHASNSSVEQKSSSVSHVQAIQNAAPRVHINPNFRPKTTLRTEMCPSTSQRSRVHINPHWRGKFETAPETTLKPPENQLYASCNSSGKTTIFVNPKVLPHLRLESTSHSEAKDSSSNQQVLCKSEKNVIALNNLESKFSKCSQPEKEPAMPKFEVVNSTKLIAEPDQFVNPQRSFKNTSSKYKLVRNSTSSSNFKVIRGSPGSFLKRTRKKSENIPSSTSKSIYKFVRDVSSADSVPKQLDSGHLKWTQKISVSQATGTCGLRTISVKKDAKSQFKLVKVPNSELYPNTSQPVVNKPKTVYTRYKLIRSSSSNKLSSKKNIAVKKLFATVPGLPLQSQFTKSRFKISRTSLGTGMNLARRVSRFAIVSTSNNSKPQRKSSLVKFYRSEQRPKILRSKLKKLGAYGNISWQNQKALSSTKSVIKLPQPSRPNQNNKQKDVLTSSKSSNRSLINIGGVLYRSTRTSLTRTHPKESKEQVLNIRGKKFVLDDKGTTLRPKCDPGDVTHAGNGSKMRSSISRIDIGGVTFIRRSDNTLVRTNTHFARSLLSLSKMRSIAFLRGKHSKINQPCLIYQRFGKCHAHEAGKCWRVHNPKNISICRKFLQGNCEAETCLLSHDVGPEKMPTCRYFLEGCCVRDNCPYLHVKLSAHAAICREFLNGYCEAGDTCKKRHVFICPDFEQLGKCSKGKYCPYPHKNTPKIHIQNELRKSTVKSLRKNKADKTGKRRGSEVIVSSLKDGEKRKRYYDESKKQTLDPTNSDQVDSENNSTSSDEDFDEKEEKAVAQIRTKIGILPAYIPLE